MCGILDPMDPKPIRETILDAVEECLDAQLLAVRRLRRTAPNSSKTSSGPREAKRSRSQIDMAYDILKEAAQPSIFRRSWRASRTGLNSKSTASRWFRL